MASELFPQLPPAPAPSPQAEEAAITRALERFDQRYPARGQYNGHAVRLNGETAAPSPSRRRTSMPRARHLVAASLVAFIAGSSTWLYVTHYPLPVGHYPPSIVEREVRTKIVERDRFAAPPPIKTNDVVSDQTTAPGPAPFSSEGPTPGQSALQGHVPAQGQVPVQEQIVRDRLSQPERPRVAQEQQAASAAGARALKNRQDPAQGPAAEALRKRSDDRVAAAPAPSAPSGNPAVQAYAPRGLAPSSPAAKKSGEIQRSVQLSEPGANRMRVAPAPSSEPSPQAEPVGRDRFAPADENAFKVVREHPVSTFSIDVDTASYSFMRASLARNVLPQPASVRVEEMVNYFPYDYPAPASASEPFRTTVAVFPSPWAEGRKLVQIGIRGYSLQAAARPRANLVFLIDTSGSMNAPNRLPLVKQSLSMLLTQLEANDRVAIVTYAGNAGTALEPTSASERSKILAVLERLEARGSTAGAEGIRQAYALAEQSFDPNGVNRVILATDGDFNVGITDRNELKGFVERQRSKGIFLSVLGFGMGNYNDALMQVLAQNGNGAAAYIDTLGEARKVLVEEATSTLFPIAKDVKIQVEFNPATVAEYRLIGYETRLLNRDDFTNDKVDAGDVGSGQTVTALYEIVPAGGPRVIGDLRYATPPAAAPASASSEYAFVKMRYKLPRSDVSREISTAVDRTVEHTQLENAPVEARFAAAVAGFGELLRGGRQLGTFGYDDVLRIATAARGADAYGYRSEFLQLVRAAKTASALNPLRP
jgi:Ca-activated chloride channel homolog